MEKLHSKLDDLHEAVDEIKQVQVAQAKDIEHHIYRTGLAEERLDYLEEMWDRLKTHLDRIEGAVRMAAGVGSLIGISWIVIQIINHLK